MKIKPVILLPLLAAVTMCGGCVMSTAPVGDKVAVLKPEVWNTKWQSDDGEIVRTKIKDAKLGIVEVKTSKGLSLNQGNATGEMLVRNLGPLLIVNERTGNSPPYGYQFARADIDGSHLVTFDADEPVFERLIKRHEIAGAIDRDKDGKPTGSCLLYGFSDKDYWRLKREGFDLRSLFSEDPSSVLIHYRWHPFW